MAETWTVRLDQFRAPDVDEDGIFSDGDEPYLIVVGFRSTFLTPGSTSVFWNGHLDDDWASGIDDGGARGIPGPMGTLSFAGVDRDRPLPEILGFLVLAMESDATPFGAIRSKLEELRGVLRGQLASLVEGGNINVNDPGADLAAALAAVKAQLQPTFWEAVGLFLSSFTDPDDIVGLELQAFAAVQAGRVPAGSPVPVLAEGPIELRFQADGIDYRVSGRMQLEPRIVSPRLPQGGFVSAVVRSADHLDVFATDEQRRIVSSAWEPGFADGWHGWWHIRGGLSQAGAPIHAVARSADHLDVFAGGTDGGTYSAAWEPAFTDGWHGWWHLLGGRVAPGAHITAVSRSRNKLDIFCVGTDGHVYTAAWEPGFADGWHGWWQIPGVEVPQGSHVGAVVRSADHLDIFVTDVHGRVMSAAWEPGFADGWHGWWHIRGGMAKPGAPVTAVSRSKDKLDIFVTGTDGRCYTAAWEPGFADGWHGWWRIGDILLPQGAYIGAVSRSTDKLDVFATATNGNTCTAAWEPAFADGWHGWWHIRGGRAAAGAPITAVSRSRDKLDVFVTGTDGRVYTAAWEPAFGDGWHGWWSIGA